MGVLEIFDRCPGDLWWVSWNYFVGFLDIYDEFPWHIWWVSL